MKKFEFEHHLLHTLAANIPHRIYAKDLDGYFTFANESVAKGMGVDTPEDLFGKRDFDFYPEKDAALYHAEEQYIMRTGIPVLNKEEHVKYLLQERERWLLTTKIPLRNTAGETIGIAGINYDVTLQKQTEQDLRSAKKQAEEASQALHKTIEELSQAMQARKKVEEKLREQALQDSLTGLPNRALLMDRLENSIRLARRNQQTLTLMFIDLDRLKIINDSLGHVFGDKLLTLVAQRIRDCIRAADTLARLGGDEFVLLLPDMDSEDALLKLTENIAAAVAAPVELGGKQVSVSCSIGCSFYPKDGEDATSLLQTADAAMYQAKEQGGNQIKYYAAELDDRLGERLELELALKKALAAGEFLLHYQPQLRLADNRIVGVEALVRWMHPEKGLIPPSLFIPIAEETGLIMGLGEWVLQTACRQALAWQRAGLQDLRMSVNLSACQFLQPGLDADITQLLQSTGLSPQCLELELTESVSMQTPKQTMAILERFKALDIYLAIDDFGTGYSNFTYLHRFPVDCIKIDRSFVSQMSEKGNGQTIVAAMIAMAHELNLRVVAEGVETEAQYRQLQRYHCDLIQGYWFSRPLAAAECDAFMREHNAHR
ncbi:MAG: EAL domain-containing protein [Cellvibrionaceae bacterium]|nr:EAL domain-containing protein [Cellvibrionaceae bacterium]